jgi:hypothetical protein
MLLQKGKTGLHPRIVEATLAVVQHFNAAQHPHPGTLQGTAQGEVDIIAMKSCEIRFIETGALPVGPGAAEPYSIEHHSFFYLTILQGT